MKECIVLPISSGLKEQLVTNDNEELEELVSQWITERSDLIAEIWTKSYNQEYLDVSPSINEIADKIIRILTHRIFNFQSKINLTEIIPKVHDNLIKQIALGSSINFFLLYNGGYRASPLINQLSLNFEPDQTELMLLYQISILYKQIHAIYPPGIEFYIVVNNGVAKWVNDIPISNTENYANQLRKMIAFFGAENNVHVLLQSELVGFNEEFSFEIIESESLFTDDEHNIVERFLGRKCSFEEAKYRSSIYKLAESKWASDLAPLIAAKVGITMRQIAHPDMLSFRPFPGGAIRIQNGTFGFQFQNSILRPKLITSKITKEHNVQIVSYYFPWK
jgi:hypothetical protein